jgi:hypothetical protein
MVGTLPLRPSRWTSRGQSAARVASAGSPRTWRTASRAAASPLGVRPPAWGRGAIVPVVRRRCRRVSTPVRLPPNRAAKARWEPSFASEARRIFARRARA